MASPNDFAYAAPGQQMAFPAMQVGAGQNQVGDTLKSLLRVKELRGRMLPQGSIPSAGMPDQAGSAADSGIDQNG
jgi:hypothetical protein